ncbi:MAG: RrF2 family transcriptional regulator [Spirochaetota bacterium]
MQISTGIDYALHGLVYLARQPPGRVVLIDKIAEAIRVPESYLRKVFQALSREGLVVSQRGAKGGYYLSRPPGDINLSEVVHALEGQRAFYSCQAMRRGCGLSSNCPIKGAFAEAEKRFYQVLENNTLKEIVEQISGYGNEVKWISKAGYGQS